MKFSSNHQGLLPLYQQHQIRFVMGECVYNCLQCEVVGSVSLPGQELTGAGGPCDETATDESQDFQSL